MCVDGGGSVSTFTILAMQLLLLLCFLLLYFFSVWGLALSSLIVFNGLTVVDKGSTSPPLLIFVKFGKATRV